MLPRFLRFRSRRLALAALASAAVAACGVYLSASWRGPREGTEKQPMEISRDPPAVPGSAEGVPAAAELPRFSRPMRAPPRAASIPALPPGLTPIELREVTDRTGVRFRHTDGSSGRRYILEAMTGGLATFDYDNDGRIDIYFVNGAPLPGAEGQPASGPSLYRNAGDWRFEDVTARCGLGSDAYGMGATAGDCDNDGFVDLYVSRFGANALYRNRGGVFRDVTRQAGVGSGEKVGAGVAMLDADADGRLDIFVARYVQFSFETHKRHTIRGFPIYPSPLEYRGEPCALYRNRGDETFADAGLSSGVGQSSGRGMGVTCADYDADGATDIFVANDVQENFLFHNDGRGRFEETAMLAGVAYDAVGQPHANMGVDAGDYDNDGRLDFFVTAYQREAPSLYRNLGQGLFDEVSERAGAAAAASRNVTWGCGLVDFNSDGFRDLYIACGHTEDNVQEYDRTTAHAARNVLLINNGQGGFLDVSEISGDGMRTALPSRGAAFEDLDNDGDIDVVVLNLRGPPTILRNMLDESGHSNHWLQIRLRGIKSNRDGVGARVSVVAGDLVQVDEVHSGRGYQSHWGSRLHFGLGRRPNVDRVEVRWIGGGLDVLENVPADQVLTLDEGRSTSD